METVNALQLRQSIGRVLARLKKTGRPILLEEDRKPAAVIISLQDYRTRFVDVEADQRRAELVERAHRKVRHLRISKAVCQP